MKNSLRLITLLSLTILTLSACSTLETSETTKENGDSSVVIDLGEDNITVKDIKPTITGEKNATITGKSEANYQVWAYINKYEENKECITINSETTIATVSDDDGNFELKVGEQCTKDINVFVVAIDPENISEECYPESDISESISFTLSGDLDPICGE